VRARRERDHPSASRLAGTVVAAHGRSYLVALDEGRRLPCFPRGKRSEIACGDRVQVALASADQGVIEAVEARSSLLYRSDAFRQKIIAANVSQVVLVLAAMPSWYEDLLNRCLVAAECAGVGVIVVFNKIDLPEAAASRERLGLYESLGYPVVPLSARLGVEALRPRLLGHTSVFVGQSGMGKSTIVNALFPEARAATAEISAALDSGRHTTTHATLYTLDTDSAVIDSPGLQDFGLHHLEVTDVDAAFREFRPFIGRCRFANCRHLSEPGCAVLAAVGEGTVSDRRLAAYRAIVEEKRRAAPPA
jgi:ribosome biogenesis GTPase